MAGYIFNLDSLSSLELYCINGVYSTKLSPPNNNNWRIHHEGTIADYSTMEEGDNVYFFIKRKIYGIGKLFDLKFDCKFSNYPNSSIPKNYDYVSLKSNLLWDEKHSYSIDQRWICTFVPSPYFFKEGVDMDDVLSSNPNLFKMLRSFWKVSFLKFDEDENQAFKDILLKTNKHILDKPTEDQTFNFSSNLHNQILNKLDDGYKLDVSPILNSCNENDFIKHEMAIEVGILNQLSCEVKNTTDVFGKWDYLSHQVVSSPLKPIDYMDKMDIFGYSYITNHKPTKSNFLIIEIKKGKVFKEDIEQLLKYVDWVKDEYSNGDYSMINSFLVGYEFEENILPYKNEISIRNYVIGRRPVKVKTWSNLSLVRYKYVENDKILDFNMIG